MTRFLVVTAVDAEREAVLRGLGRVGVASEAADDAGSPRDGFHIMIGGVGVASAAARTASRLATVPGYAGVLSMGIGGAYPGRAALGGVVIGTRSIAADLGAGSPDGFLTIADLGLGTDTADADQDLVARLTAVLPAAATGSVLTVHTVTGTAARAADLAGRHTDAVAEAMEGWGVATAAGLFGVPFAEIRTVSNLVGPRDRATWRIGDAMGALAAAAAALATLVA